MSLCGTHVSLAFCLFVAAPAAGCFLAVPSACPESLRSLGLSARALPLVRMSSSLRSSLRGAPCLCPVYGGCSGHTWILRSLHKSPSAPVTAVSGPPSAPSLRPHQARRQTGCRWMEPGMGRACGAEQKSVLSSPCLGLTG